MEIVLNQNRRRRLTKCLRDLEATKQEVQSVMDDEEDSYNSIPENLIESERYLIMEEIIDMLSELVDNIESTIDGLNEIINR